MITDFWTYIETVIGIWFGWWAITAVPVISSLLMPDVMPKVTARLDLWVPPGTRRRIYRVLLLAGIFVAGFIAWRDRYRDMVNEWKPQVEQRDKTIRKLQDDNKKTIAQWQDNAHQQAKQFDDRIKACRNGYDALLNEITNLNSDSEPLLDYMGQLRQQFDQEHVGSPVAPGTIAMEFRTTADRFRDRWQNPCN